MASALELDLPRFDKAMTELSRHSNRTASDIVTLNGRTILKSIVFNSPRFTGTMNGGWLPAWNALNVPGFPKNKPRNARAKRALANKNKRVHVAAGKFLDDRRSVTNPSVEMRNMSHYVENGKKVNYPHIVAAKTGFVRKAEDEVEGKFGRMLEQRYQRLLRSR